MLKKFIVSEFRIFLKLQFWQVFYNHKKKLQEMPIEIKKLQREQEMLTKNEEVLTTLDDLFVSVKMLVFSCLVLVLEL